MYRFLTLTQPILSPAEATMETQSRLFADFLGVVHLLDHPFSVIWITETKITKSTGLNFNPNLPKYQFWIPTKSSILWGSADVVMYTKNSLNYRALEKTSSGAFQALWIEIEFLQGKSIICGAIYRQHNSPERFQTYFDETLDKLSYSKKPISKPH